MKPLKSQQRQDDRPYIRKIDFVFYNEREIRLSVADARASSPPAPEINNGSGLPDPTATIAIRNLSPVPYVFIDGQELKNPESWLTVISKTYSWCKRQGEKFYEVARARYDGKHFVRACAELDVTLNRFYWIMERVRNYAALQAAQLNLIYVD